MQDLSQECAAAVTGGADVTLWSLPGPGGTPLEVNSAIQASFLATNPSRVITFIKSILHTSAFPFLSFSRTDILKDCLISKLAATRLSTRTNNLATNNLED